MAWTKETREKHPESWEKMRLCLLSKSFKKGSAPWNKGIPHSPESKLKMSVAHKGVKIWGGKRIFSETHKEALRLSHVGRTLPEATKKIIADKTRRYNIVNGKVPPIHIGPDNHNWKGGVTPINEKIRKSVPYQTWRRHVFIRDNYTCQACGTRGGDLQADHDLPFALFPDLRFEVLNGRTMCKSCHRNTPTYGDVRISKQIHML